MSTVNEHLDRIGYALELTARTTTAHQNALESLTALRAALTEMERKQGIPCCEGVVSSDPGARHVGCLKDGQRVWGSPAIPSAPSSDAANRESDAEILAWLDRNYGRERPFWYGQRTLRDAVLIAMRELKDRAALPNPQNPGDDAVAPNGLPKGKP